MSAPASRPCAGRSGGLRYLTAAYSAVDGWTGRTCHGWSRISRGLLTQCLSTVVLLPLPRRPRRLRRSLFCCQGTRLPDRYFGRGVRCSARRGLTALGLPHRLPPLRFRFPASEFQGSALPPFAFAPFRLAWPQYGMMLDDMQVLEIIDVLPGSPSFLVSNSCISATFLHTFHIFAYRPTVAI